MEEVHHELAAHVDRADDAAEEHEVAGTRAGREARDMGCETGMVDDAADFQAVFQRSAGGADDFQFGNRSRYLGKRLAEPIRVPEHDFTPHVDPGLTVVQPLQREMHVLGVRVDIVRHRGQQLGPGIVGPGSHHRQQGEHGGEQEGFHAAVQDPSGLLQNLDGWLTSWPLI